MAAFLTWAGKILGGLLSVLCLADMIAEGGAFKMTRWHLSLDIAIIGLLLGLFKPLWGGAVALIGIAAFYVFNYHESGKWPQGPVFPLFRLAGILLVVGAILHKRQS